MLQLRTIFCLLFLIYLTGCVFLGPTILPANRKDFNSAIQKSEKEQLLLNIVRMKYLDEPFFLGIISIAAQLSFNAQLGASDQVSSKPFQNILQVQPSVGYADKPTISYAPLQGEKFARNMLAPMRIENVFLLLQSSWDLQRVLRLTTQFLGDIPNAPGAARPGTNKTPRFRKFVRMVQLLDELKQDEQLHISLELNNDNKSYNMLLNFKTKHSDQGKIRKVKALLRLPQDQNVVRISQNFSFITDNHWLLLRTRSILGMMYYLSKSVWVTDDEIKCGIVQTIQSTDGKYYDWHHVTKGMMNIYYSQTKPCNALVSVFYRGRWYYIADNDLESKETFALMEEIFSLQAGDVKGNAPILTIPV